MTLKKSILPITIIGSFLLATFTGSAFGAEGDLVPPKYTGVFIENISYEGEGCQAGTVASQITSDHRVLGLLFNSFGLQLDGQLIGEQSINCNIQVTVDVPPEYEVALSSVNLGGILVLPKGAGGSLQSQYFMSGQASQNSINKTWFNDEEDWAVESFYLSSGSSNEELAEEELSNEEPSEKKLAKEELIFSNCGENAVIDINTQLNRFSNEGVMLGAVQVNSMANTLAIEYEWRECEM
jgi:hypothetical protein